ncbi:MAG: CRISPR-associated endonuclease Cas6 [Candidatus Odinarchaeota archaeon]
MVSDDSSTIKARSSSNVLHYGGIIPVQRLLVEFDLGRRVSGKPSQLRGNFAKPHYSIHFHHYSPHWHERRGYPLIQYKFIGGRPCILGLNEAVLPLKSACEQQETLELGDTRYPVLGRKFVQDAVNFGTDGSFHRYRFGSPWFALNSQNHGKYKSCSTIAQKRELLTGILAGNLKAMSKAFSYWIIDDLKPDLTDLDVEPVTIYMKSLELLGFTGIFRVNFLIPDYFGVGKSTSKGYGWVHKV